MTDIRPLNFGEILDGALVIYRRHFGLFLRLAMVVLAGPVLLLVYLATRWLRFLVVQSPAALAQTPDMGAVLLIIPVFILYYLASLVLTAGTVRIIADSYLGRAPRLVDALSLGLSRLWGLVVVGLGKGIIVFLVMVGIVIVIAVAGVMLRGTGVGGVLLLVAAGLAGLWLVGLILCGYGVTTPVLVLEDLTSAFDAFGRSWELTRGFRGKVFGLAIVSILLFNALPIWVLQALSAAARIPAPAVSIGLAALAAVVPVLLTPAVSAVWTLMYYDLRVRREAFDLQVLSRQLGIV
ncbi:MAG TPA: hypothetical protein VJN39_08345 [Gemmatimonadales bacterium]|nr:hypothetical protein [Gemmatimonadales bacterium]